MLKEIHDRLLQQNMFLYVDESAKKYLVDEGYDPVYGARPIRRAITTHLESKVTLSILQKQVVTLRSIILVEYDNYRQIHTSLYPLPSFVLSPFNKDIINFEENEKAILSYIGVVKNWKKKAILPQKYLIHYYEDSDMYEETEQKEERLVKRAKEEIMDKVEKLMIENESKNLDDIEGLDKEPKILIGDKKDLDD
jgi:hypothetical protein